MMRLLQLERVPEPEVMQGGEEVEVYSSAATVDYFDRLDDDFVAQALRMGVKSGSVLDVGTGPGQIPLKIARLNGDLRIVGIDLSDAMLAKAEQSAREEGLYPRVSFRRGDAKRIPFDDNCFDLVISNCTLHHVADPLEFFNELARVARRGGAIFVRDLCRPSRLTFRWHVNFFGRYYTGLTRKLYEDSVRAAYNYGELKDLVARSCMEGARVVRQGLTHLVVERRRC
jgi:ubiquinone/menaquinone biosynthesis C-methylase UbiE